MKTKTLLLLVAAVSLSGCAVYPAYDTYEVGPAYVAPPPVYIYGSGVYRYSNPSYVPVYPRGYYRPHSGPGRRNWSHNTPSNRWDRDGDGIRNRNDRWPNNPRAR